MRSSITTPKAPKSTATVFSSPAAPGPAKKPKGGLTYNLRSKDVNKEEKPVDEFKNERSRFPSSTTSNRNAEFGRKRERDSLDLFNPMQSFRETSTETTSTKKTKTTESEGENEIKSLADNGSCTTTEEAVSPSSSQELNLSSDSPNKSFCSSDRII